MASHISTINVSEDTECCVPYWLSYISCSYF